MKVSIEIKELLLQLETMNPELDLTGVKAYLLDLALGTSSSVVPVSVAAPSVRVEAANAYEAPKPVYRAPLPPAPHQTGASSNSAIDMLLGKGPEDKKAAAKRKTRKPAVDLDLDQLKNLSSREIIEQVGGKDLPQTKVDGQFVDEGGDSGMGSDLVVG